MTKFGKIVLGIVIVVIVSVTVYFMQRKPALAPVQEETPGQTNTDTTNPSTSDDLVSFSILPNTKVHGVVSYRGIIKGGYFFEGNILINVLDANKNSLKSSNAHSTTDWMTAGPVDFEGNIDFTGLAVGPGFIEIHNDNASGLPEHDKSVLIPIVIEETKTPPVVTEDPVITMLKGIVKKNPFANIKECKTGKTTVYALYPDTQIADDQTTFYDEKGKVLEKCGGFRAEPSDSKSLCATTLPSCTDIYYQSHTPNKERDMDIYHLKS